MATTVPAQTGMDEYGPTPHAPHPLTQKVAVRTVELAEEVLEPSHRLGVQVVSGLCREGFKFTRFT